MRFRLGNPYAAALFVLVVIALVAAAAIPGLIESPRLGYEKAATETLRRVFAAGEAQARVRKVADADGDGQAEYLPLAELVRHGLLQVDARPDADGTLTLGPYRFAVHLPDGLDPAPAASATAAASSVTDASATAATTVAATAASTTAAEAAASASAAEAMVAPAASATAAPTAGGRELHYVVYAWPVDTRALRQFAIDERGVVHYRIAHPPTTAPAWDALYDGRGWGAEPTKPWWPVRR